MDENNEDLKQFMNITGVDIARARFYLESSAGELDVALSRFYENDGEVDEPAEPAASRNQTESDASVPQSVPSQEKSQSTKKANTKFATLNTLNSSSDEEEQGQAFYAGGSQHSGQQVLGPSKKRDIVADMFKSVREHGVEVLEPGQSGSGSRVFRGTGYRLGQTENDSETVPGDVETPRPVQAALKLWRDGFSIDDGELRDYADPANREFLDSIKRGEIPRELRQGVTEVHLSLEDHRMEEYKVEEKKPVKAFSGQGYTLGSPAPPVIGATRGEDMEVNEQQAKTALGLDTSQPVTSLQIRLSDGSRLLGQFNHTHTIGQVRSYIITARPQYQTRQFSLLSTYPSRELDDSETIASAGLLNSAIMQKLK